VGGWRFPRLTEDPSGDGRGESAGPFLVLLDSVRREGVRLSRPLGALTGDAEGLRLSLAGSEARWTGNPLDHLDEAFARAAEEARRLNLSGACFGGAFHYDLRRCVERFGKPAPDSLGLPWLRWHLFERVTPIAPRGPAPSRARFLRPLETSLDRPAFESAVQKILDREVRGDTYQVNLTRQIRCAPPNDLFPLWEELALRARAPLCAFAELGGFSLLSLSPERFLRREGGLVWTEPIKGTAPRGSTDEEDAANLARLLSGEKEAAELAMIVDVERNDLGRVAVPGSVRVAGHRQVLALPNVYHLASTVTAELKPGVGIADILRATFPGGSVTGAPKIRAMQIIDELEPVSRGYYCGALGWMDLQGDLDLSLTIRTATFTVEALHLGVGGGIVADSDPASEWEETAAKARCFLGDEEIGR
jgi:hypothetical protein